VSAGFTGPAEFVVVAYVRHVGDCGDYM
jgi:hypothetical protein